MRVSWVWVLLPSILLVACSGGETSPTGPITPSPVATSITLSSTSVTLDALGDTAQLSATLRGQTGEVLADLTVTWDSSDTTIVAVSSAGLVTAVAPGTANVTATHRPASAPHFDVCALCAGQSIQMVAGDLLIAEWGTADGPALHQDHPILREKALVISKGIAPASGSRL